MPTDWILILWLTLVPGQPAQHVELHHFADSTACEEAGQYAKERFNGRQGSADYICFAARHGF